MKKAVSDSLHLVPLFKKLTDDELNKIFEAGSTRNFSKNEMIFLEGEPFTGFYVVLQGTVKVYRLFSDGSEAVLHLLKPYKSFAETPLFTDTGVYPACAQATEDSILFCVPKAEFRRLMEGYPSLSMKISGALASRLMELNMKIGQLSVDAEARLARFMIGEITSNGSITKTEPVFTLTSSKKDLAAQLGIAVETLSRALRKLKDQKIIRESSKKIFVLDVKRLQEMSK